MVSSHLEFFDLEQWKLYYTDNQCLLCKLTRRKVCLHQHCPQKTNEESAVVALQVVVHEATSKANLAIEDVVHLFGGEVKVVMISRIISFSK